MTEMMSGVKTPDDAVAADGGDGLDEQLISQLVDRAKAGVSSSPAKAGCCSG